MNTRSLILRYSLAAAALLPSLQASALDFAQDSRLATGRWHKIAVSKSGIYEISFDKLRELGFSNPEKVAVYGCGGREIPLNFMDIKGNTYVTDDLQPVPVSFRGNSIIFYAQGPEALDWVADENIPSGGYFDNSGLNFYSPYGYYFISEADSEKSPAPEEMQPDTAVPSGLPCIYGYAYHETDSQYGPNESGKEMWGESFTEQNNRTASFSTSFPGIDISQSDKGAVAMRFMHDSKAYSTVSISGAPLTGESVFGLPSITSDATYSVTTQKRNPVTYTGSQGDIQIVYLPKSASKTAYLDYFLFTYPRSASLAAGESQYIAVADGGNAGIKAEAGTEIWDVTDPARPVVMKPSGGYVFLPEGCRRIVKFKPSSTLLSPEKYERANNSNLHRLALDNDPRMIIIATDRLYPAAEEFAQYHNDRGETTLVVRASDIYNEFSSGRPDPMAYRLFIKMIYDKQFSSLENVLLMGEIRGAYKLLENKDAIIAPQSESGASKVETHSMIDILGMTDSFYSGQIQTRPIRLPIAVLPFRDISEARLYLEKLRKYENETDLAYWADNFLYLADDNNNGLHVTSIEYLTNNLCEASGNRHTIIKNYLGEAPLTAVKDNFYNILNSGASHILYMGHGGGNGIGTREFLRIGEIGRMKNDRFPFMVFGGCSTTMYESLRRGISEAMVIGTRYGFIGTLATVREVWAQDNQNFINEFQKEIYSGMASATGQLPSYGKAYLAAKKHEATNNKFNFNLICDPLVRPYYPTLSSVVSECPAAAAPGIAIKVKGSVLTPDNNPASGFNGSMVVKWFAPEYSRKQQNLVSGDNTINMIKYDQDVMASQEIKVSDGQFEATLRVPDNFDRYAGSSVNCVFTGFDPGSRLTSYGKVPVRISAPGAGAGADADTQAPSINLLRVDASDPGRTPSSTVLLAEVTDDNGLRTNTSSPEASFSVMLDGTYLKDISSCYSLSDGARRMDLAVPLENLAEGSHDVRVSFTDYAGNTSSAGYSFIVSEGLIPPLGLIGECRRKAALVYPDDVYLSSGGEVILSVTDLEGNLIASRTVQPGDAWDLTDDSGRRVPQGIYKAVIRFGGNVSEPLLLPVLAPLD